MKKRTAIIYRMDQPGGVQSCVFALIRGLNDIGIVPEILWDCEPDRQLMTNEKVNATFQKLNFCIPSKSIDRMPNTMRYLAWLGNVVDGKKFLGEYDFFFIFYNGFIVAPDMPHVYYLSGPPLLPQLETRRKGIGGCPIRFFRFLYRYLLHRISPVYDFHRDLNYVINSHYTAALFKEAHRVELQVVHPPINLKDRAFAESDLAGRDTITFFSRIVDYKRPEFILDLACRHRNFRYVIMGGVNPIRRPYFEHLKRIAVESGQDKIVFIANPSSQTVREELSRTRFYIFPAQNEHFGMTTPEAIASGAVPYVHNSGGQKEIVPDKRLRFTDDRFLEGFESLLGLSEKKLNDIRMNLSSHVGQFSEPNYVRAMLAYTGWTDEDEI